MMKFIRDILTGPDNRTYDGGHILCFLSYFMYFGMTVANFITSCIWSSMDFAAGVSAMCVGFGIHFYMKKDKDAEPGV